MEERRIKKVGRSEALTLINWSLNALGYIGEEVM